MATKLTFGQGPVRSTAPVPVKTTMVRPAPRDLPEPKKA